MSNLAKSAIFGQICVNLAEIRSFSLNTHKVGCTAPATPRPWGHAMKRLVDRRIKILGLEIEYGRQRKQAKTGTK